jgi:branched-chain amino acid transport system permease protein
MHSARVGARHVGRAHEKREKHRMGYSGMNLIALSEQVLNGLVLSVFYALAALGLAIIFGVLKIVNFAHGELYMIGGFAYYAVASAMGLPSPVAVLAAFAFLFALGIAIEWLLIRPVHEGRVERPDEYAIMVTFGLAILLQNLMLSLFGPWTLRPPALFRGAVEIGELIVSGDRLAAAALGLVLIAFVIYLLRWTWAGKAIRAVSQDRETAAVVGVDDRLVGMLAFGLGSALAGAAGALMGPVFLVHPTMGVIPAIKAYVVVVIGGMGSVPGAIVGALLLGQVENLATVLIPDTTRAVAYKDAYGLVLLVLVLLLRPQGLFGERTRRL